MARSPIFNMFGASPIRPLQEHMAEVVSCVVELVPFFTAVLASDWDKAREVQQRIVQLENEADDMKRALRLQLPSGLMMAMSRRDLLEVLSTQDRIANKAKDIAGIVLGRKMSFPYETGELLLELIKRCIDAVNQAQRAIDELDELLETGFKGREVDLVESMITKLDEIESDADKMQLALRHRIFEMEKDLPPVDVVFIYQIIEWIGDLADLAQRVGSRLEIMLAR